LKEVSLGNFDYSKSLTDILLNKTKPFAGRGRMVCLLTSHLFKEHVSGYGFRNHYAADVCPLSEHAGPPDIAEL
jgi:hypothetical protein